MSSPCPARLSAPLCLSHVHEGEVLACRSWIFLVLLTNKNSGRVSSCEFLVIFKTKKDWDSFTKIGTSQILTGNMQENRLFSWGLFHCQVTFRAYGDGSYDLAPNIQLWSENYQALEPGPCGNLRWFWFALRYWRGMDVCSPAKHGTDTGGSIWNSKCSSDHFGLVNRHLCLKLHVLVTWMLAKPPYFDVETCPFSMF